MGSQESLDRLEALNGARMERDRDAERAEAGDVIILVCVGVAAVVFMLWCVWAQPIAKIAAQVHAAQEAAPRY